MSNTGMEWNEITWPLTQRVIRMYWKPKRKKPTSKGSHLLSPYYHILKLRTSLESPFSLPAHVWRLQLELWMKWWLRHNKMQKPSRSSEASCIDLPLHRLHVCTASTPAPCHCRAAGNCWPSPSYHNIPVWPRPSPPSAPWGPPGAKALCRSRWATSLLLLEEIKSDPISIDPLCCFSSN